MAGMISVASDKRDTKADERFFFRFKRCEQQFSASVYAIAEVFILMSVPMRDGHLEVWLKYIFIRIARILHYE